MDTFIFYSSMLPAVFFRCQGIYFSIFVNYWNFGHNGMIAISNFAIKHKKLTILSTFHLFVSTVFLSRHCHFTSYLTRHILAHIYATVLFFHAFFEDKNSRHVLQVNTVVWWRRQNRNRADTDGFGPVPSGQSFSDGTELRRDGEVPVIVKISV
jgi:hypothetical protein